MAKIQNQKLTIKPIPATEMAECTVTCDVSFSGAEINAIKAGYKFSLQCEIWAADKSAGEVGKLGDDKLFTFPTEQIPDSTSSSSERVKFFDKLGFSKLDEDGSLQTNKQQDEIYAKLILTSKDFQDIPPVKTAIVKITF